MGPLFPRHAQHDGRHSGTDIRHNRGTATIQASLAACFELKDLVARVNYCSFSVERSFRTLRYPKLEALWEDDIEFHRFSSLEVQPPRNANALDQTTRLVVEEVKTWKKLFLQSNVFSGFLLFTGNASRRILMFGSMKNPTTCDLSVKSMSLISSKSTLVNFDQLGQLAEFNTFLLHKLIF